MELEASSVAVNDPGDPNLGKHQGSRSIDSGKQIPQELSLSEIMPFETSHESRGIPDQEFQQVESRDLPTLDQLLAKKMPTDSPPPKRLSVYLFKPYRGDVTCDEAISILRESQLDTLDLRLSEDSEEDGSIEAYREDRLHLFDAIGKCESLKLIRLEYVKQLHVEEILLLRPALEERIERLFLNVSGCDQRGMTILCEMLAKNNVLEFVSFNTVEDGQLAVLCQILPTYHTFKPLYLTLSAAVTISGAASLVSILGMNSIVGSLLINDAMNLLGSNGLKMILDLLTGHSENPPLNQSLKKLLFLGSNIGEDGGAIKGIAEMLRTNNSLTKFSIMGDHTLKPSDVCTILSSLENNQSLRELDFSACDHVEGADVLGKIMDLLRVNPWLRRINLSLTPLQREGQAAQVRAQLERNAQDYMKVVRGMPRVPPKFTKVFLCGNAYSGKPLNSTSLKNIFSMSISYEASNVC